MTNKQKEVVITSAVRTPIGAYSGSLKNMQGHELGSIAVREAIKKSSLKSNDIDEMLVKSTILHGKLTELVKLAEDPTGEKGKEISKLEKKEIMEAIKNLENKILKIKLTIDQK